MFTRFRKHNLIIVVFFHIAVLILIWFTTNQLGLGATVPVQAAPDRQIPIYTPTAGPDGRIIWIVKANDTLLSISLISGVPVAEIRGLNNLTSDTIYENQKLLLGLAGPEEITVTPGPTPTATQLLPPSIPDGAISISNQSGTVSENTPTGMGLEPQCYEDLPEDDYTVSVAVPDGYNPTTETSYELVLKGGDETYINFGAQANAETLAEAQVVPAPEGGRSPILGILGGLFLLAGLVVAFFAARTLRGGKGQ